MRTQGSRPRPRTQKNFEAKATPSRGQSQGPRTQTQVFSKKKVPKNFFQAKKVFKIFFSGDLCLKKPKKRSLQIFREVSGVFQRNFNGSKIVLSSSRGQGNFRGLEASRPRPRTSKCVLEDSTSVIRIRKKFTALSNYIHEKLHKKYKSSHILYVTINSYEDTKP